MAHVKRAIGFPRWGVGLWLGLLTVAIAGIASCVFFATTPTALPSPDSATPTTRRGVYDSRSVADTGGFQTVIGSVSWAPGASLAEIGAAYDHAGFRLLDEIDGWLAEGHLSDQDRAKFQIARAQLLNYEGEPRRAYQVLEQARAFVEQRPDVAQKLLFSVIYFQGVTALRCGETENCILCRGESSCIVPISQAAQHTNPDGSRRAIGHFTEYLDQFSDDFEVWWLLNLAHMTLGEHPQGVDPRFLIVLDRFSSSEFDIGRFRDIGQLVGVNRFNQSGGAIMDDFDNDGLLDIAVSAIDPTVPLAVYHNTGQGSFSENSAAAGVTPQLGGLNCLQTDYDNDGFLDIFVVRGAWLAESRAMRPSLLRNNGDGTFSDLTGQAGLSHPVNSIAAAWGDYDNDGGLDLFVCCERQPSRLYHSLLNGTFEEVALAAGVVGPYDRDCKGAAWIDFDNDGNQDLYLNYFRMEAGGKLFRNLANSRFADVTDTSGIHGPQMGFSCWAWDYNNDGWLDLFASSADWTLKDIVRGLAGLSHRRDSSRLFLNRQGTGFENVAEQAGLGQAMSQMGSNFGDFDNDGYLDVYLGTGGPGLETLVPNRMFKNIAGRRFADVTASSRTGNLQKGHAVACGDWDRDGQIDVFIQMGGPTHGDKYHNILFENPGHPEHHFLTLKLVGAATNRAALGARIKLVTAGDSPQSIHRHVSSGSSFGANPLEQTIGLGQADRLDLLEIFWPVSGTIQTFRDVAADQSLVVHELGNSYHPVHLRRVPLPTPADTARGQK